MAVVGREAEEGTLDGGGGTNWVACDPETRGKVIPTGAPPCGSQLMGRNGPRRWGRHAVAEPHQRKVFLHG